MKNLIVPIGDYKQEYEVNIPYLFRLNNQGFMYCINAIKGLDLNFFDKIYFTIQNTVDKQYFVSKMLNIQFQRMGISSKTSIVILDKQTKNQADTIHKTIIQEAISGFLMIKDADGYFESTLNEENSIMVYPIDSLEMINPQNKSYVEIDDLYYVTNIIEKRIIGRWFAAGGYIFENAKDYCTYYDMFKKKENLCLSHIIFAMLLDKKNFRPIKVKKFADWGTQNEWSKEI